MRLRKRQSTITEQYSPSFRRRLTTNFLSLSLPGIDGFVLHQIQNQNSQQQTHTQQTSHKSNDKRLQKAKQLYQASLQHHNKINLIIDEVDQIIKRRMEAHEQGLLSVVKSQIQRMQADCKKIVEQYNQMMEQKNKQTQIYNLKNQLDYFRSVSLKYYQQNKRLLEQNKQLRALANNKDSIIQQLNQAIKKSAKKYLKEKIINQKKQRDREEAASVLWHKIKTVNDQPSINISNNLRSSIKQEMVQNQSLKQLDDIKTKQKSSLSHRYQKSKTHITNNYHHGSIKKRLNTEKTILSLNVETAVKPKNSGKSKSFWKFDAII